jgi:putative transposase
VKFAFIDEEKATWPVDVMCDVFAVSRSGFYAWKSRPTSPRALDDAQLIVDIKAAHKAGRGNYEATMAARVSSMLFANGADASERSAWSA